MDLFYWLGIVGAGLILIAFLFRQHKKYGTGTLPYEIVNLIGSIFLIVYSVNGNVLPFIILNSVWAINSVFAVTKILRKKH